MWNAIKQQLKSTKVLTALAGIVVWIAGRYGLDIDASDLVPVLGLLISLIVGKGLADVGKEARRLDPPGDSDANE